MRFSAPLYLFDQKDNSLKVVPLGSEPFSFPSFLLPSGLACFFDQGFVKQRLNVALILGDPFALG
jgi:hypothetical protein